MSLCRENHFDRWEARLDNPGRSCFSSHPNPPSCTSGKPSCIEPVYVLVQLFVQQDGTLGSFRPADDIFEEASRKFQASLQSGETDSSVLSKDILRFASLKMVKESLKRICDVKGSFLFFFCHECFLSSAYQR